MTTSIIERISAELAAQPWQVEAAVALLDGGSTVPFIARYRKEATGTLDDTQLRRLDERLRYLRELEERRKVILELIETQANSTTRFARSFWTRTIRRAWRTFIFRSNPSGAPRRRSPSKADSAPLADALLSKPEQDPKTQAAPFVNADKNVATVEAALEGARAILVERFAEDADLIGALREAFWSQGALKSKVREGKETSGVKFSDYFEFSEPLTKLPSHRILALFRGEKEEFLDLEMIAEAEPGAGGYESRIARRFAIDDRGRPGDRWLAETVRWAWRTKIELHLGVDARATSFRLRRGRSDQRLRQQFARSLARRARRSKSDARTRPRVSHRRQGRRRGQDGQDRRHHGDLSA